MTHNHISLYVSEHEACIFYMNSFDRHPYPVYIACAAYHYAGRTCSELKQANGESVKITASTISMQSYNFYL